MKEFNVKEIKEELNKDDYYNRTFKVNEDTYKSTLNKIFRFKQEIKNEYDTYIKEIKSNNLVIAINLEIEKKGSEYYQSRNGRKFVERI